MNLSNLILVASLSFFLSLSANENKSDINQDLDSQSEKKKNPLEQDEDKDDSGFRKKPKKHSLTPEQVKKKKEILEKIIRYGSNKERKEALRELSSMPSDGMEDLIKLVSETLSTDQDNGIKISCLRTLGELDAKSESEKIIPLLKDKSDDVREVAIQTINRLKINEAANELNELIKNQDFTKPLTLTNSAINTLAELENGKISSEFLENKIKEKNNSVDVRSSIALYYGKTKDIKVESTLLEIANDESEDMNLRAYSINALGKMNSPKATPELRNILGKINESKTKSDLKKYSILKLYVISALIMLGDKEILKELVIYAKDDDASVRLRAVKQLGEIPDPSVVELIEYKASRDPSKKIQDVAKKIIEDWKQKGVISNKAVANEQDQAKQQKENEKKKEKDSDEWMINKGKITPKVFPR
jgi:HEAT repeat protein